MATLDAAQLRNLPEAYITSDSLSAAKGLDLWLVRDVMTTMLVTESDGGHIYANDGQGFKEPSDGHTPWNWNSTTNQPIGTPASRARMRGLLLTSMDEEWLSANGIHYDRVGSNGRSTGPAQQLSTTVGGSYPEMAHTMRMGTSMSMFLGRVDWGNQSSIYLGRQMPNKESAMLLRVQQPLPSEVGATDYDAALARAKNIGRDSRLEPGTLGEPVGGELDNASSSEIYDAVTRGF